MTPFGDSAISSSLVYTTMYTKNTSEVWTVYSTEKVLTAIVLSISYRIGAQCCSQKRQEAQNPGRRAIPQQVPRKIEIAG